MKVIPELNVAFNLWCEWNIKKIPEQEFIKEYGIDPMSFHNVYWENGLQDFWIKRYIERRAVND